MKTQKGITLVALIITVIVLLILAAVVIGVVQNDGIILHTKNAKNKYGEEKEEENSILKEYLDKIESNLSEGNSFEHKENGTSLLTLSNSIGEDLVDYKIYGNSIQDGTPTPETLIEIESVGDKSVNILPYPYGDTTTENNGITWTDNGNGTITANGTATARSTFLLTDDWYTWNGLESEKNYYFSGCPSGGSIDTYDMTIQDSTYTNMSKDFGNGAVYTANSNPVCIFLIIREGVTVKNLIFNPIVSQEPIGYKIPVKISGINLFDINKVESKTGFEVKDNTITITKNAGDIAYVKSNITPEMFLEMTGLKEGDKIVTSLSKEIINATDNNKNGRVLFSDKNGTVDYNLTMHGEPKITTIPENFNSNNYTTLVFVGNSEAEEGEVITKLSKIMICKEQLYSDEYELYVEPIITNIYLEEPLRKIGDYADYIDFKSGKVIRNVKQKVLIGEEGWDCNLLDNNKEENRKYERLIMDLDDAFPSKDGLCNICLVDSKNAWAKTTEFIAQIDASKRLRFYRPFYIGIIETEKTTNNELNDEWKLFLEKRYTAGNPVKIDYILATPIEETIELPNIPTTKGTTILEVDTKIQPSNMEVKYLGK